MPKITFIQPSGDKQTVDAEAGRSVMEAASANMIRGIIADCGGCCSCATCHVYVAPEWRDKLPPPEQNEKDMVEGALDVTENSRLSCQIKVTDELDGLVVQVPASQI